MPVASFRKSIRIRVIVGDETVVLVCRQPTGAEVSKFLSERFTQKGRKITNHHGEARVAFINRILIDVENATYENADGQMLPLNAQTSLTEGDLAYASRILDIPVRDWKDLVNASWKATAAMTFEESQVEDEGSQGN